MGFSLFLETFRVGKVPPRAIEKGATVRVSGLLSRNTGKTHERNAQELPRSAQKTVIEAGGRAP